MRPYRTALIALLGAALLPGCDLAPVYDPPHYLVPESYQGSGPFRVAHPETVLSTRGDWWTMLGDAQLNELEEQLDRANPTLEAAAETYTQARDLAAEAQSVLYPQVSAQALVSENKRSAYTLFRTSPAVGRYQEASNQIGAAASWEPDF